MKRGKSEITNEIINKCKEKDYGTDKLKYINAKTKIELKCNEHGYFKIFPYNFLKGCGCSKCANNYSLTTEEFINKCKQQYPNIDINYDKVVYINNSTDVIFNCSIHGDFKRTPASFLKTPYCPECQKLLLSQKFRKSNDKFLSQSPLPKVRGLCKGV